MECFITDIPSQGNMTLSISAGWSCNGIEVLDKSAGRVCPMFLEDAQKKNRIGNEKGNSNKL